MFFFNYCRLLLLLFALSSNQHYQVQELNSHLLCQIKTEMTFVICFYLRKFAFIWIIFIFHLYFSFAFLFLFLSFIFFSFFLSILILLCLELFSHVDFNQSKPCLSQTYLHVIEVNYISTNHISCQTAYQINQVLRHIF